MGEYVKIAETKDVSKNQTQVFNVKEKEILVVNVEGKFYAFDNHCPHMGALFFLWKPRRRYADLRFPQRQIQRENWEIIRSGYK